MAIAKTRINMNLPNETLKRVDDYAEYMNLNRTSAIVVLLNTALDSKKALNDLSDLLELQKVQSIKGD